MNTNRERIIILLDAYTNNRISDQELEELSDLVEQSENDAVLSDAMKQYWDRMPVDQQEDIPGAAVFEKITADSRFVQPVGRRTVFISPRISRAVAYAASIILIIGLGAGWYLTSFKTQPKVVAANHTIIIQPGSNKAILTLADGSEVVLSDSIVSTVAAQGNASIQQVKGKLLYSFGNADATVNAHLKNTVKTPRGGQYQLILQDGTKVWLNAASSITYPIAFDGAERRVAITGEAYFEVARNAKMPFKVVSDEQTIEVLGTTFNISAYNDDDFAATTLVEGAVKVNGKDGEAILQPRQQAMSFRSSGSLQVKKVDTEQALAWKNGYFMFASEDIKVVMKLIARWYDIDLEFRGDLSGKTFGGTISRFDRLEDLLHSIEFTDAIHFEIHGRKVVVMP